jgi:hypothetical protein
MHHKKRVNRAALTEVFTSKHPAKTWVGWLHSNTTSTPSLAKPTMIFSA